LPVPPFNHTLKPPPLRIEPYRLVISGIPPVRFRTSLGLLVVAVLIPVVELTAHVSLLSARLSEAWGTLLMTNPAVARLNFRSKPE
jgi:hypothetical protein